jgi:hypothetical protein
MNISTKTLTVLLCVSILALAVNAQQTANQLTPVEKFSITGYPYYGAAVTPNDSTDLTNPGYVRADADGAVTANCFGPPAASITLNLTAGEFFPCLVSRVFDTGTDAITLHVFY